MAQIEIAGNGNLTTGLVLAVGTLCVAVVLGWVILTRRKPLTSEGNVTAPENDDVVGRAQCEEAGKGTARGPGPAPTKGSGKGAPPALPGKGSPPAALGKGSPPAPPGVGKGKKTCGKGVAEPGQDGKSSSRQGDPPLVDTSAPLRQIRWRPLDSVENTIFSEIDGQGDLLETDNAVLLKEVFVSTPLAVKTHLPAKGSPVSPKKQRECILDKNRAQQIAITIRRSKSDFDKLCRALDDFDMDFLIEEDDMEQLQHIWPSEAEQKKVRDFKGPKESLRDVEQWVLSLANIPRSEARMKLLSLSKEMTVLRSAVAEQAALMNAACEELFQAPLWRCLLTRVLRMGNFMNKRTTEGFQLESLLELGTIKGAEGVTALHCLVIGIARKDSSFATRLEGELSNVRLAVRRPLQAIREQVDNFGKIANFAAQELRLHGESYSNEGPSPCLRSRPRSKTCCGDDIFTEPCRSHKRREAPVRQVSLAELTASSRESSDESDGPPRAASCRGLRDRHFEAVPRLQFPRMTMPSRKDMGMLDDLLKNWKGGTSDRSTTDTITSRSDVSDIEGLEGITVSDSQSEDEVWDSSNGFDYTAEMGLCSQAVRGELLDEAVESWVSGQPVETPARASSRSALRTPRMSGVSPRSLSLTPRKSMGASRRNARSGSRTRTVAFPGVANSSPSACNISVVAFPDDEVSNVTTCGESVFRLESGNRTAGIMAECITNVPNSTQRSAEFHDKAHGYTERDRSKVSRGQRRQLEILSSQASTLLHQAREDLSEVQQAIHKCDHYFGAAGDGHQLFSTVSDFIDAFKKVWDEVHRGGKYSKHFVQLPSRRSPRLREESGKTPRSVRIQAFS